MEWLTGLLAHLDKIFTFGVFLTIGLVAAGISLFSLFLGELGDAFGIDHDFDHPDHDLHVDHGADHPDSGGDHTDMAGLRAPGFFSFRIIMSFVAGFGLVGAICSYLKMGVFASSGIGILAGFLMAVLMYAFVNFLAKQQASANISANDLVGKEVMVIVKIPKNEAGQIQATTHTGTITYLAQSEDGSEILEGNTVKVTKAMGQTVIVTRLGQN
ncbi:DUF1449 family protein [Candidatus Falkowbacteria bacterium]|nr:DUF1449 family protein [Candidatus Falkowbacteria bacterium]